jgi:hypothetical protein
MPDVGTHGDEAFESAFGLTFLPSPPILDSGFIELTIEKVHQNPRELHDQICLR